METLKYCPICGSKLSQKSIEGIDRSCCASTDCDFVHWDNPLPVVAALIEYQGQILLAQNTKWPSGIFSLITGFLERKESPEQAVIREVKEELNLDGRVDRFIGFYPFDKMNQIIMAFSVTADGILKTNKEIAQTKLITIPQLRAHDFGPLYITTAIVRDWFNQSTKVKD